MTVKQVLLFFVISLSLSDAKADWVPVAESTRGNTYFADETTIRRQGNITRMWVLESFSRPEVAPNSNKVYWSAKMLRQFDCQQDTQQILSLVAYTQSMGRGVVLFSEESVGPWEHIPPRSIAQRLLQRACRR